METERIEPALTAEEWRLAKDDRNIVGDPSEEALDLGGGRFKHLDGHALAAINLYGQPFGFTHEDVDAIRTALMEQHFDLTDDQYTTDATRQFHRVLAKIEALLPPRTP
jgi:hypothetical protein